MALSEGKIVGVGFGLCAVLAAAILLPLTVAVITGNALTTTQLMSADGLWTLALMQDIFADGGHLADWNLAQHSDLFPDKTFATISYAISARPETWLLAFEALNLALYFAIAWYCMRLYFRAARQSQTVWGIALWAALVVTGIPSFLRGWGIFDNYFRFTGGPAHHFGSYFCAVLAVFIVIDCFDRALDKRVICRAIAASTLILLVVLSDKLSILIAIPGLLVAAAYFAAMRRAVPPGLQAGCALLCAAVVLGYFAGDPLWNRITEITPAVPNFDPARLKRQAGLLAESLFASRPPADDSASLGVLFPEGHNWYGLRDFLHHLDPIRTAICGLAIVFATSTAATHLRRAASALRNRAQVASTQASADAFIIYLIASAFLLPSCLITAGVLYSYGVELYVYPSAYLVLWAAVAMLGGRIVASLSLPQLTMSLGTTALILSVVPIDLSAPPFEHAPTPPLVKCLEEFGKSRTLRLGLASHWETYPVNFSSHGQIIVRTIAGSAKIEHWIDNYEWYAPRKDGQPFTFVIPSIYVDTDELRDKIGDPTEVLDCASLGPGYSDRKVLYYEGSAAERLTAGITDQYLNSRYR